MAIKVTCPGCQDQVIANSEDAGKSIKCGTCWTEIKIPAASMAPQAPKAPKATPVPPVAAALPATPAGPAASKPAVAQALPANPSGVKVAQALPAPPVAAPAAPTAKPLVAEPSKRKPAEEAPVRKSRRNTEIEEDDDTTPEPKKGGSIMIVLLIVGFIMFMMVAAAGGLIWYLMSDKSPSQETTTSATRIEPTFPVDPTGSTQPTTPRTPDSKYPTGWKETIKTDDFYGVGPYGFERPNQRNLSYYNRRANCKWHIGYDFSHGIEAHVIYGDLPDIAEEEDLDYAELIRNSGVTQLADSTAPLDTILSGKTGKQFRQNNPGNTETLVWVWFKNPRVYIVSFKSPRNKTPMVDQLQKLFFGSLVMDYQPGNTPPPVTFSANWKDLDNAEGFTARGPKLRKKKQTLEVSQKFYAGQTWDGEEGGYRYFVSYHDFPPSAPPDWTLFNDRLFGQAKLVKVQKDKPLNGKPGSIWEMTGFGDAPILAHQIILGSRVYTFSVGRVFTHRNAPAELKVRFESFMKTVAITFDPNDPTYDPLADARWVSMPQTKGFTVDAPSGMKFDDAQIGFGFGDKILKGSKYTCEDDIVQVIVQVYPITPIWNSAKIINGIIDRHQIVKGPTATKLGGLAAEEHILEHSIFRNRMLMRTVVLPEKILAVQVITKPRQPEKAADDRIARVFSSFRFDGGNPGPMTNPGTNPNPGTPTVPFGSFAFAGRIAPHMSGVGVGKDASAEFLAFSTRPGTGTARAGVIRRYSTTDFKLKGTYNLQYPVNRAVADEKAGRLYCSVIIKDNPQLPEREQVYLPSVVHVYDLKKLQTATPDQADVKPVQVFGIAGTVAGLEIAPDGSELYVAAQVPPTNPRQPTRGKLYRFDLDGLKEKGVLDHPEAFNCLKLSDDGKTLVAGELSLSGTGAVVTKPTNLIVVDPITWKKTKSIPLPNGGPAIELTFVLGDIVAQVINGAATKMIHFDEEGQANDITPALVGKPLFYLHSALEGNFVLGSAGPGNDGFAILQASKKGNAVTLTSLANGDSHEEKKIGGNFTVTSDQKYIILQCGTVIDLVKTRGK